MPLVLVACEFSGVVRQAFRAVGCDAWSCDLMPNEHPEGAAFHIQGDVRSVLGARAWDLVIAHPPCTYLSRAGEPYLYLEPGERYVGSRLDALVGGERIAAMHAAAEFFRLFFHCAPRVCIENPQPGREAAYLIGRRYNHVVHPWEYGHAVTKRTCLWLENLPPLLPPGVIDTPTKSFVPSIGGATQAIRAHRRSKTFPGIAAAMAAQWGPLL